MGGWRKRVFALTFLSLVQLLAQTPRRPRGIYAVVNIPENINKATAANPSISPSDLEAYFVNLYQDLLANPAVSGLALWQDWRLLNPNPPGAANAYDWSWFDDAFNQAAAWNSQNPTAAPKTVQLVPLPGFQTPKWLTDQIPSCDGLFQTPVQTPSTTCGKATFTGFGEGGGTRELPMPWNPLYKSAWKTFLTALAARYLSNPAFVSISIAGPTASSEEMILPDNANTPAQDAFGGILPNAMWIKLLTFHYAGMTAYQRSDQAFIDEWQAAIDMYGQLFSGVTLVATTGSGLPNLAATGFSPPPIAFAAACPNPDMDCAAETGLLAYLGKSTVGGANAKAAQEDGMEASRLSLGLFDLGVDGIKLVARTTAQMPAPASQILGGAQFNYSFSNFLLQEGCTAKFPPNASDPQPGCSIPPSCTVQGCIPVACIPQACLAPGVTPADIAPYKTLAGVLARAPQDLISPEQAAYNVLHIYFEGTPVAATFGGTPGSTPFNYLQIYAADFQYAEARAGQSGPILQPGGATVSMSVQDLLNLAAQKLGQIGEPAPPPAPSLSIRKTWQSAAPGLNPQRGAPFTYTITVANNGTAPAAAVTVRDTPDSRGELSVQGPLVFNLGPLAAGASQSVSVNASAVAAGAYTNAASVSWSDAGGVTSSAGAATTTAVDPLPGDLAAAAAAPFALQTGVRQAAVYARTVYVVNNPGDSVTILDCTGGTCAASGTVPLPSGSKPVAAALLDVDGDGFSDLLVLNPGTGAVTAVLSSNPAAPVTSSLGAGPLAFTGFAAGDGVPRIAVTFPGALRFFAWNGQRFQQSGAQPAGQAPSAIVNTDVNGDGVDDLLVASTSAGTVQIWLGDGAGGFNLANEVAVGASPVALAAGDINNDQAPDAAVITSAGLVLLLNDGTGNLVPQPVISAAGAGAVVLADFNGDGNLDAAVANTGGASVSMFRGDGSGALTAAGLYLTGKTPLSLAASDLTGNGNADLIVADGGTQDLTILIFRSQ